MEQKSGSVVCRSVGFHRYEGVDAAATLTDRSMRLSVNFFQPSLNFEDSEMPRRSRSHTLLPQCYINGLWRVRYDGGTPQSPVAHSEVVGRRCGVARFEPLGKYISVVGKGKTGERQLVILGRRAAISSGVSEGDQVMAGNLQKIFRARRLSRAGRTAAQVDNRSRSYVRFRKGKIMPRVITTMATT